MPADTDTAADRETDRMRLIDGVLRERHGESLRAYLARMWADGNGDTWDNIALDLRQKLTGTPYERIPRETVSQYARRYGVAPEDRPKGMARIRRQRPSQ